jgi:hypothetical protein
MILSTIAANAVSRAAHIQSVEHKKMNGISSSKSKDIEKSLSKLYETWVSVEQETLRCLGNKTSLHLIDFHGNNCINISKWITTKYTRGHQLTVTFVQFIRLIKELHWLQFVFNHANYPMVYRELRYVLEMMSQAWYIESIYPDLHLDGQIEHIMEMEEKIFGWKLVRMVFSQVLNIDNSDIEKNLKPTWILLNKHVHSSAKQMSIVANEDFSSFVTDSFNDNLARATLAVADEVFDLIYTLVLTRFPHVTEFALQYPHINEWEEFLPYTMRTLRQSHDAP